MYCFQDMEKMEREMIETSEKLAESEKLNSKLQKDLGRVVELQQKVSQNTNHIDGHCSDWGVVMATDL